MLKFIKNIKRIIDADRIYDGKYRYSIFARNVFGDSKDDIEVISSSLFGYDSKMPDWLNPVIGLRCKLNNPDKCLTDEAYNKILNHPEMRIRTTYYVFDENEHYETKESVPEGKDFFKNVFVVTKPGNKNIGNVVDAYYKTKYTKLDVSNYGDNTISVGFNAETRKWAGWSHRALVEFGIGDRIFEEDFGDEATLFTQHGKREIMNTSQAKYSARKFAESVS